MVYVLWCFVELMMFYKIFDEGLFMSIYEFTRWYDDYVMSMILWVEHLCTWAWAWKWKRWYNSGNDEITSHYHRGWPVPNENDVIYVYGGWYERDDVIYVICMADDMKEMMLHKHAWHMTLQWWDLFMWVFILNVSICLCAGDATAHNVYRYEWLHMMFYDDLYARRFSVHMRREM